MTTQEKNNKKNEDAVDAAKEKVAVNDAPGVSGATKKAEDPQGKRDSRAPIGVKRPARGPRRGRKGQRKGFGGRVKSEFDQKVIDIRRVTRVVSGGRRFSFSVALVAGNRKGSVGVGIGKSSDTSSAIEKASRNAKKNMIKVKLNKNMSIPHEVKIKFASTRVLIKPAPGKGLVAGSSIRNVLDLAGVKDVSSKLFSRSKNKLNNAKAAIEALKQFK